MLHTNYYVLCLRLVKAMNVNDQVLTNRIIEQIKNAVDIDLNDTSNVTDVEN